MGKPAWQVPSSAARIDQTGAAAVADVKEISIVVPADEAEALRTAVASGDYASTDEIMHEALRDRLARQAPRADRRCHASAAQMGGRACQRRARASRSRRDQGEEAGYPRPPPIRYGWLSGGSSAGRAPKRIERNLTPLPPKSHFELTI